MKKTFIAPELELLKFESDAAIMEGDPDPWSGLDPWGPEETQNARSFDPFRLNLPERVDLNEYFKK